MDSVGCHEKIKEEYIKTEINAELIIQNEPTETDFAQHGPTQYANSDKRFHCKLCNRGYANLRVLVNT